MGTESCNPPLSRTLRDDIYRERDRNWDSSSNPLWLLRESDTVKKMRALPTETEEYVQFAIHSVYSFRPVDCQTAVAQLEIYGKLRALAPPKRWANLDGEVFKVGRIGEVETPEVCLVEALASFFPNNVPCWHVDILESVVMRSLRGKDDGAHLDGDPVHQWDRYPSQELQDLGRKKHFRAGFSIVASWKEVIMTKEDAEKAGFIGVEIALDCRSQKVFAVVGSKSS
jgi:hypothetical protein